MANPLLTVVTVTYNPGPDFLRTSESVQGQSLRSQIEYLVIDGASTDGTVDSLEALTSQGVVDRWISEPDSGIYNAMNKGTSLARGEYVLFLNAGDTFPTPDTIERFFAAERPDFLWGDSEVERDGYLIPDPAAKMLRRLHRQMTVCHQSLAVRKPLLLAHPFDLTLKVVADYAVLCALVKAGHRGLYRPVVVSRVQEEGFSSRNFFVGLSEKRQISRRFFPRQQWRARPYFTLWGLYMRFKIWYRAFIRNT